MNSTKTNRLSLFFMFFFLLTKAGKAILAAPSSDDDNDDVSLPCNRELLISMGFIGYNYSEKLKLEFCPTVVQSCCTVEDQLNVYEYWIQGKEENLLDLRLKYQRGVYFKFFENIEKVQKKAKKLLVLLKKKRASNCKILAKRILHFNTADIFEKLRKAFESMHLFFQTTYSGLYCNLCDAKSQFFFDLKKGKYILNQKFCRDITANTLHTLIYMYIHVIKLTNLVSKFIASCNPVGEYTESIIPSRFKFSTKKSVYNTLMNCKRDRNAEHWFRSCVHLCNHFKVTSFPEFFQPHLKKIESYNAYTKKNLDRLRKEELLLEILKIAKKKNRAKILKGGKDGKNNAKRVKEVNEKVPELINPFDKLDIYESIFESHFHLSTFKSSFRLKGMDLYGAGAKTTIDDESFDLVKTEIKKNEINNEPGEEGRAPRSRWFWVNHLHHVGE